MKKIKILFAFLASFLLISCGNGSSSSEPDYGDPSLLNNNYVHYYGRTFVNDKEEVELHFSATGLELKVDVIEETNSLNLSLKSTIMSSYQNQFVGIFVDDVLKEKKELNNSTYTLNMFENVSIGEHYVKLVKLNEKNVGSLYLDSIEMEGSTWSIFDKKFDKRIEFYGDSITCGYGVLGTTTNGFEPITEDATFAYPYLTASALNYDYSIVSQSGISMSMNAFNSNYFFKNLYPTYDGVNEYDLSSYSVDLAVVNIGTNDNTKLKTFSGDKKNEMATKFYNDYLGLVLKIKEYNPDCKFILCYDMMTEFDGFLVTALGGICDYLNTEFDECAYLLQFQIDYGGSDGHPGKTAHQRNAGIIADYIKNNIYGE